MASLIAHGAPAAAIRLQCLPRGLDVWLAEQLPVDFHLDPRQFALVLSLVEVACLGFRVSWQPAALFFRQIDVSKAPSAHARCARRPCTANVPLQRGCNVPQAG